MVRFGDVAQIVTGSTPKAFDENFDGNIPFVTPGDLGEVADIHQAKRSLSELGAASVRTVPKRSVMVCCIGATIGKVGFATRDVATNQQINTLVFDEKIIFPKYAYYYCLTIKSLLVSKSSSTTMPIVNKSNFSDLKMPVPFLGLPSKSLAEQKRIAEILDKADVIRRKRKQAIQLADDFLRSVFLDMFGDPVTNPKGWEVKAIKDLATVTTGNTPSRKVPEYFGNDVEWIKSDNINTPHHILTTATEYLSHEGVKVARTVPKGSTLITCIAGSFDCIGNAAFTDREVSFNQQINALTPKDGVLSWFLYALIIFSKKIIQNASTNSMKGMISKGKLEEVKLFLPPLDLQRQFEDILDKQTRTVERMNSSNESDHELFNSLSQKAFAGEL